MFGHILRGPENSPAALSLSYAVEGCKIHRGRRGRHKVNLLSCIRNDIKRIPVNRLSKNPLLHNKLTLKSQYDIDIIRSIAHDKKLWKTLYMYLI